MFSLEFGREEEPRPDPTMLVGESASGASAPEAKHCRDALPSSPSIPSLHRWRGVPTSRSFAGLRVGNFGPAPHGALAAEQFTDQTKRGRVVAEMYSHSAQCRRGASRVLINKDQVYTGRHCFLSQEVPQVLRRGAG